MVLCAFHLVWYMLCSRTGSCRLLFVWMLFFQAEDGIRDLVRSRGLGDVYKRQLVRRRGHEMAVRHRRRVEAGGDQPGDVGDVRHEELSLIHI